MSESSNEQLTPIDRPLMRSDLNEVREAIKDMANQQLQFMELAKGFTVLHDDVVEMKRVLALKLWAPTIANTVLLLANFAVVLWSRIR